jgi:hypothetical protein
VEDHRVAVAQQAAWRPAGELPAGVQRHPLALPHRLALADIPERYGPSTTCYNRFVRWREAGVWDRVLQAISAAYDGALIMIDSSNVRVHQHGATGKKGAEMVAWGVPVAA